MTARTLAPAAPHRAAGPADQRAALQRLARDLLAEERTPYDVHRTVDALVGAGRSEASVWALFQDLTDAVRDLDGLNNGTTDWRKVCDDLTGTDLSDAAADIARERVRDALNALTKDRT
jgi:hypothetical protein